MILCLDIGNTQIFGGVYENEQLRLSFRYDSTSTSTSDQLGVFLKSVLHENHIEPTSIKKIAIGSVVPSIDYSIRSACIKYFNIEPFMLSASSPMPLTIKTEHPHELGADLIATAIGAMRRYPQQNVIIADFGTATTFAVITASQEYLGTVILAGMRLSMQALGSNTAKLFPVEIVKPTHVIGKNTTCSVQSGLYYGHLGIVREMIKQITKEAFSKETSPITLGTGGFVHMFESEALFTAIIPNLVLEGLLYSVESP